jgi:hypothetical protein
MKISTRTIAIFTIFAATGLIWAMTVSQPADAWHSLFGSKKLCTQYLIQVQHNTTKDANFICNKIVPH